MNYADMVRNAPRKSEKVMWDSVEAVSELLEKLKKNHPEAAMEFLMKEYERMYGPHFCEEMAREVVSKMYHLNSNGERVEGEVVSVDDSMVLLGGVDRAEEAKWDAYVGANGFMHDLAKSDLSGRQIMEMAKVFWFDDDDFVGDSKVFWYYSNK